jgi:gliding motility-associated lipoprotein GldH
MEDLIIKTTLSMQVFKVFLVVLIVVLSLASCDPNRIYETNLDVDNAEWKYNDIKKFEVIIDDTIAQYDLAVNVRHSFNYEWRNMYVNIKTMLPDSQWLERRVNLPMSEPDGKWFGKCMGDNCYVSISIQKNARFPQKGKYIFTIQQDMRTNPLQNIRYVGLRVEKSEITNSNN